MINHSSSSISGKALFAVPLLSIFAFSVTFASGVRGFFPHDQSFVFDGAWRVYCGQVVWRDFITHYGATAFWYQALWFAVLGAGHLAYVVGAAVLNVAGTLASWIVLRRIMPACPGLALLGAAMTAVWLYPPIATTYGEQTAFVLILIGMATLLLADGRWRTLLAGAIAGMMVVAAILAKQNAGALACGP